MSFAFLDSTARSAWQSATSQQAQLEALAAAFPGNVTLRYYSAGGTHLDTVTHAVGSIATGTDPRTWSPGAVSARTNVTTGTATYVIAATAPSGGTDILRADIAPMTIVTGSRPNLYPQSGGSGLVVQASAGLPATDLPAWLVGVAVDEWVELADTQLSTAPIMPLNGSDYPQGKQDAWCGWHADPRTNEIFSAGQGGHDNYHGNEVSRCQLGVDVPAWDEISAPSLAAAVTADQDYYTDGKPASHHGYHGAVLIESLNKLLRFPGGSRATIGNPTQRISAFDLTTDTWDAESAWTSSVFPVSISAGGLAVAKHPVTEACYIWAGNSRIVRWDAGVPGSYTTLINNPADPPVYYTAAACDPTRGTSAAGHVFYLGNGLSRVLDIGAGTLTDITLTGTDIKSTNGAGMFYCPALDKYIVCVAAGTGGAIYTITPTSGMSWACALLTTTGGSGIPATNSASQYYPFTKFLYLPLLGVAVFGPRWSSNLWALRLHSV